MLRDILPIVFGMGATLLFLYKKAQPDGDIAVLASSRDRYINLSALRTDCDRECTAEDLPRVCRYNFVIETHLFHSRSEQCTNTSYMRRPMIAVNRQVPGPAIHVCEGDFVIVNVKNALRGLAITLHWHGMRQRGSSYMDGVPLITQCPIQSGTSFQYVFRANAGTHFYRAHSVAQQADGVYGPMIVLQSSLHDATHRSYDHDLKEHVITISPLTYSALTTHVGLERVPIHSLLINGNGLLKNQTVHTQPKLYVSRDRRYRLRVISAIALDCPVLFRVDRHHFTVIQADGSPVKPFNMSSIILHPGERYDVVLRADQLHGVYELTVQGYHDCEGLYQKGLVVYTNTSYGHNESALHRKDTSLRKAHKGELDHYVPKLKSLSPVPGLKEQADYTVYLPFDVILMDTSPLQSDFTYTYNKKPPDYPSYLIFPSPTRPVFTREGEATWARYWSSTPVVSPTKCLTLQDTALEAVEVGSLAESERKPTLGGRRGTQCRVPRLDNISFEYPPSPLIYEQEQSSPVVTCSQSGQNTPCTESETYCQCAHTLRLLLGSVVDIILINLGRADDRPVIFHLHGNGVYVLGAAEMGDHRGVDEVKVLERRGKLKRNLQDPPFRDMILVPPTGYVILRLYADNAGYWMLEAPTIDPLAGYTMAMVIRVGEVSDMPPLPKEFPRCGSFKRPEFLV